MHRGGHWPRKNHPTLAEHHPIQTMKDTPIPLISDAESRVMEHLWEQAPQATEDLTKALLPSTEWHENTVRTLLRRLQEKGAVRSERDGRRLLYAPVLTREQWQTQESRSLLNRVFGGRVAPLLVHFSQTEELGAKELAELRKLVEQLEKREQDHD